MTGLEVRILFILTVFYNILLRIFLKNIIRGRTIKMLDCHAPKFSSNAIYVDIIFYSKSTRLTEERKVIIGTHIDRGCWLRGALDHYNWINVIIISYLCIGTGIEMNRLNLKLLSISGKLTLGI